MTYDGAWRNRLRHLYTQYCYLHELNDPKLWKLLEKYGAAFNDTWWYQIAGRSVKVVLRKPLWLGRKTESSKFAEKRKHRFRDPRQRQLMTTSDDFKI